MTLTENQLGRLGETAVALELMKRGYDVVNLNDSIKNYQHANLLCVFSLRDFERISMKDFRL